MKTALVLLAGLLLQACALLANAADDAKLEVVSRVHFNANVSNFERSRAFYAKLGFETVSGFPDTNTQAMARAIGIQTPTRYDGSQGDWAGGYLLHGELIGLDGMGGALIDLIEFTIPRNESPPYANLNHLGMARAILHTRDVQADYDHLSNAGVQFLSAPVTRSDGTRFAIFRDPDGIFYELAQLPGVAAPDDESPPHVSEPQIYQPQIYAIGPVNINVSDLQTSLAWYQRFGFEVTRRLAPTEDLSVARAMGFDVPLRLSGAVLTHPNDGSSLELVQWHQPYDPSPPYPLPVNHIGMHRLAFLTTDIEGDTAALKAAGVKFVSPITPCCSGPDSWGSIVAFFDPDGTVVELVETPVLGEIMALMGWLRGLF